MAWPKPATAPYQPSAAMSYWFASRQGRECRRKRNRTAAIRPSGSERVNRRLIVAQSRILLGTMRLPTIVSSQITRLARSSAPSASVTSAMPFVGYRVVCAVGTHPPQDRSSWEESSNVIDALCYRKGDKRSPHSGMILSAPRQGRLGAPKHGRKHEIPDSP